MRMLSLYVCCISLLDVTVFLGILSRKNPYNLRAVSPRCAYGAVYPVAPKIAWTAGAQSLRRKGYRGHIHQTMPCNPIAFEPASLQCQGITTVPPGAGGIE